MSAATTSTDALGVATCASGLSGSTRPPFISNVGGVCRPLGPAGTSGPCFGVRAAGADRPSSCRPSDGCSLPTKPETPMPAAVGNTSFLLTLQQLPSVASVLHARICSSDTPVPTRLACIKICSFVRPVVISLWMVLRSASSVFSGDAEVRGVRVVEPSMLGLSGGTVWSFARASACDRPASKISRQYCFLLLLP